MESMNVNISSPTPTRKEGIGALFASPTGVIDEASSNCPQAPHFAPNLDQSPPGKTKFVDIPGLAGLPPILGSEGLDHDEDHDEPLTRVADTFEEKERQRQVKFCAWKQGQECCRDFRAKAYKLEKEESMSFRNRPEEKHQQDDFTTRRIKMFRMRALKMQREEARDFKNLLSLRREVRSLDNSQRSAIFRKRLFDEAMAD
jgi:hypothetical protein